MIGPKSPGASASPSALLPSLPLARKASPSARRRTRASGEFPIAIKAARWVAAWAGHGRAGAAVDQWHLRLNPRLSGGGSGAFKEFACGLETCPRPLPNQVDNAGLFAGNHIRQVFFSYVHQKSGFCVLLLNCRVQRVRLTLFFLSAIHSAGA